MMPVSPEIEYACAYLELIRKILRDSGFEQANAIFNDLTAWCAARDRQQPYDLGILGQAAFMVVVMHCGAGTPLELPPAVIDAYLQEGANLHPMNDCELCGYHMPRAFETCPLCGGEAYPGAWSRRRSRNAVNN